MKKLESVPAALSGLLLTVAILYLAVISFTFSVEVYPQEPPYDAMAGELVGYLSGDQPSLSEDLFIERERLHMVDVLALFEGGRKLATVCLWGGLALGLGAWIWGGLKRLGNGLLIGMGVFAGIAAFIGIWAAIDFHGWFTVMHELVFTNDLWLLDPAESMLINMLPLEFFINAVKTIALRFGLGLLVLILLAIALKADRKERAHGVPA